MPNLPEPEALEKIAIDFLCEGNKELAFATADFFEKVIIELVGEFGKGSGKILLTVAAKKAAARMTAKSKEQK